jgi:hypothetical protein
MVLTSRGYHNHLILEGPNTPFGALQSQLLAGAIFGRFLEDLWAVL